MEREDGEGGWRGRMEREDGEGRERTRGGEGEEKKEERTEETREKRLSAIYMRCKCLKMRERTEKKER